ncbi:MAG: hypothetical protein ACP5QT_06210 [Brevinematia bacterium]
MKKIIFILFVCITTLFSCMTGKVKTEYSVEKESEDFLEQFSDIRPYPNVISEREAMRGVLDEISGSSYETTMKVVKAHPEAQSAKPVIVLVEDYFSPATEEYPYFYYVAAVIKEKKIVAEGYSVAMADKEDKGKVGVLSYSLKSNDVLCQYISREEAVSLLRNKLNIPSTEKLEVKAVMIPGTRPLSLEWGWAIKTSKRYKAISKDGKAIETSVFWIQAQKFDEDAKRLQDYYNGIREVLSRMPFISALQYDIFDENIARMMRRKSSFKAAVKSGTLKVDMVILETQQ